MNINVIFLFTITMIMYFMFKIIIYNIVYLIYSFRFLLGLQLLLLFSLILTVQKLNIIANKVDKVLVLKCILLYLATDVYK